MDFLRNLFLLISVCLINASPLEISSKPSYSNNPVCSQGIAYWCQNVLSAKKCNAVDFCISAVWGSHLTLSDKDVICDDCKNWVEEARNQIIDDSVSIVKSLKRSCSKIPTVALKASCENLVDENISEIFKMLKSQMKPDAVCTKLLFCNNLEYDRALSSSTGKLLPLTCRQCQGVGTLIEQKFKKSNRDEMLENLLNVCGESVECISAVRGHFNDIYDALKDEVTTTNLCKLSGACKDIQSIPSHALNTVSTFPCHICSQMLIHLRELLIANTTDVEFKNIMIGFCHQFPSFTDECVKVAEKYYLQIFNFLLDQLSANKACILWKICPATIEINAEKKSSVVEEVLDTSSLDSYKNTLTCDACEYLMRYAQDTLKNESFDHKFVDLLKSTCSKLPKEVRHECESMVDLYGDAMMRIWSEEMDPNFICPKIKLCPPILSLKYLEESSDATVKPNCPLCLLATTEIEQVVAGNKTRAKIEQALDKLCSHLNSKLTKSCNEFVNIYGNKLVDLLMADIAPEKICKFFKLCDSKAQEGFEISPILEKVEEEPRTEILNNPQCSMCKKVVIIVMRNVDNKKSKHEIRRELGKACRKISKFQKHCEHFVDKFSDKIVDLIAKGLGPSEVCQSLSFCVKIDQRDYQDYDAGLDIFMLSQSSSDHDVADSEHFVDDSGEAVVLNPSCWICKMVVQLIEKIPYFDSLSKAGLRDALEEMCIVAVTYSKQCQDFVDRHSDEIYDFFKEGLKPSELCQTIFFCATAWQEDNQVNDVGLDTLVLAVEKSPAAEISQSPQCVMCEFVMTKIEDELKDKKIDADIKHLVMNICKMLPTSVSKSCNKFIDYYFDMIIQLLQTMEPSMICSEMRLCPAKTLEIESTELRSNLYECAACKGLVKGLDTIVQDQKIVADIEMIETKICMKFAGKFRTKCHGIVERYGDAIIKVMQTITKSEEVCYKFDLCPLNFAI